MSKAKEVISLVNEQLHDFDAALKSFIDDSQKKIDDDNAKHFPGQKTTLEIMHGKKYIRIKAKETGIGSGGYAWAFIDKETGDILKSASWAKPAKHPRGNIYKPSSWSTVTKYGPAYLR